MYGILTHMKQSVIISNPTILGGKPVIRGTRIAVSAILDLLAAGLSIDEVKKEYPMLTKKAIASAISFASARVRRENIRPIVTKNGNIVFSGV